MRRHLLVLAIGVTLTACKEDAPSPALAVSQAVLDLVGAPPTRTLTIQNTGDAALTWSATPSDPWFDVFPSGGTLLAGAQITVDVDADITGLAAGAYSGNISLTSNGGNATVPVVLDLATVVVDNMLLQPVNVFGNGVALGSVPAQSIAQASAAFGDTLRVSWQMVSVTTVGGTPIGDPVSGAFTTVDDPFGSYNVDVDNVVGTSTFFIPYITNNVSAGLLMEVNAGLPEQNRCSCVVPGNASSIRIGYYRFVANGQIRGYQTGSSYTGSYVFWTMTAGMITAATGRVNLNNSLFPAAGGAAAEPASLVAALRPRSSGLADVGWQGPAAQQALPSMSLISARGGAPGRLPLDP